MLHPTIVWPNTKHSQPQSRDGFKAADDVHLIGLEVSSLEVYHGSRRAGREGEESRVGGASVDKCSGPKFACCNRIRDKFR